jgi:hypothetical protein
VRTTHQWILSAFFLALTLGVVHSGAAQSPDSVLSGEYIVTMHLGVGARSEGDFGVNYISMNFDGIGNGTFTIIYSSFGDSGSAPFTYSVNSDGTFSLDIEFHGEESTLRGIVSSDGVSFTMWPFSVGIRKSSGMSNTSLNGEYVTAGYFTNDEDVSGGEYISMNYGGNGSGMIEIIQSSFDDSGSYPCTYSVSDDGTFLMTVPVDQQEDIVLQGIVSADGESFTMVSTDSSGFGIWAGLKKSFGHTDASLNGEYIMIQYMTEEHSSTEYVAVDFAGDGNAAFEIVYSSGGDSGDAGSFTYSVNDDGTFSITVGGNGGGTVPGILSPDGKRLAMAGPGSPGCAIMAGLAKWDVASGVIENPVGLPACFALHQNYPNPFNPSTTIEFALPHSGLVTLKVYNVLGEEVATLIAGERAAGTYRATWDASGLPSGVYLFRLTAGEYVHTKKMVLMK